MGRNAIPKIGEWRDGTLYRFRASSSFITKPDNSYPKPDDGRIIVFERVTRVKDGREVVEVLAIAYANGFQDVMAAMWMDGHAKGKQEGYKNRSEEIIRALLGEAGRRALSHKEGGS